LDFTALYPILLLFLALIGMFLFYDWPFLHVCILQENLFSILSLAMFSAIMSSFMGILISLVDVHLL